MVSRVVVAGSLCFLTAWLGCVGLLWAAESDLVFMTDGSRSYTSPFDPAVFHQRRLSSGDGTRLHAVSLSHPQGDRYWILFCPASGSSIQVIWTQQQLKQLWTLGYNVFAFDYRGFGESSGTATEQGLYEDAAAAYAHLVRTEGVSPSRIILSGRSLGSAVAVDLASKVDSAGVLLFSPIDSVPAVAARLYPWAPVRWLAQYEFDSLSKANTVAGPVLMFYGWPDSFMRRSDARSLLHEFRGPKRLIETGGGHHFAGFVDAGELNRELKQFWPVR